MPSRHHRRRHPPGFDGTAHFATVNTATNLTPNLTASSLTLDATSKYVLDLGAGSTGVSNGLGSPIGQSSLLLVNGNISLGGATLTVNDTGVSTSSGEVFKFIQYTGTWDGTTFASGNSVAGTSASSTASTTQPATRC